ncbi:hypothetical protein M231_01743 [Tremella mesenterica]|uniref:Uncharacterized protein n=1 Tax=Tremella mesenterica TaxID=5217 RepID=A0A4Q1BS91_TREME|nr:hypothetical protein M231_01743 [Tremella mesenterica]
MASVNMNVEPEAVPVITITPATLPFESLASPPLHPDDVPRLPSDFTPKETDEHNTHPVLPPGFGLEDQYQQDYSTSPDQVDGQENPLVVSRRVVIPTPTAKPISIPEPSLSLIFSSPLNSMNFNNTPWGHSPSLAPALWKHLRCLHPSTPDPVIDFIAYRLLSQDRPFGFDGSWEPVRASDMKIAGLEKDAAKGVERKKGTQGEVVDKRVERMYEAAKKSYAKLAQRQEGVERNSI